MLTRRTGTVAAVVLATALLVGCGGSSGTSASDTTTTTAARAKVTGAITVSAAASLTEAFGKIGRDFAA